MVNSEGYAENQFVGLLSFKIEQHLSLQIRDELCDQRRGNIWLDPVDVTAVEEGGPRGPSDHSLFRGHVFLSTPG